uniref:Uncharacterized protein n=1 Tax=Arundo donax TaxID=35708 RepID=A0A0A9ENI7_ARUDO
MLQHHVISLNFSFFLLVGANPRSLHSCSSGCSVFGTAPNACLVTSRPESAW